MGKGGNVVFRVGAGAADGEEFRYPGGDFVFELSDRTEVLRIKDDGSFVVRGDKVADDAKLFTAFREWVKAAVVVSSDGQMTLE